MKKVKPVIKEPEKTVIPKPKVHVLNNKTFTYKAVSYQNFHLFTEIFDAITKEDTTSPMALIKYLFKSGTVKTLMQLYLLDKEGIPPTSDFLNTVPPAQILNSLSDFFGTEGNLLLNGMFSLLNSIR